MKREFLVNHYENNESKSRCEEVAEENQLTLFLDQREVATFLCSPSDEVDLAVGYLVSEGIIHHQRDILSIDFQELDHFVRIMLDPSLSLDSLVNDKKVITSGCGKGSILLKSLQEINLMRQNPIQTILVNAIYKLMREFQLKSELFLATGGVHSVGLCTPGEILMHKEDIGRHNAVDKILGECLMQDINLKDKILLLSGRMAVEIVQKAGRAGIQILLSKSAPTSMAIDLANKIGMSLVGFIRGERMNVYTHPKRIISS